VTNAVAIEKNTAGTPTYEGVGFPYPIFVAMPTMSDDIAYGLTKAVMENYETYKDSGPGMDGYQVKNQNLSWIFPYHPGAIAYWKEIGKWTADNQANTEGLLKRNQVLATAWKAFKAMKVSGDDYETKWLAVRKQHLEAAGMPVPFPKPLEG
jgi:hypothetical protein